MVKKIIQALIAIAIIALGVIVVKGLVATKPEVKKVAIIKELPVVETMTVKKISQPIFIKTQGEITPPKRTTLSAQVMGKVLSVSPKYEVGETFEEGEVIMTVEDIDYRTALVNAKATKTQAEATLKESEGNQKEAYANLEDTKVNLELEQAKVAQAKRDWEKLGRGKKASDLLLRKPQIKAAEAKIKAASARIQAIEARSVASTVAVTQAQANIEQAQRDLERTRIRAPYACQLEEKQIDLGALVTVGMPLTTIYERGSAEARLPIPLEDISYVKVGAEITAKALFGNELREWKGKITRNENRIDPSTRTSYVIAEFTGEDIPPIGLFADIELAGKELKDVYSVPRIALRNQNSVIVITPEDKISFREVKVTRTSDKMVYLSEGLKDGERVCITVVNTPIEGTEVNVVSAED